MSRRKARRSPAGSSRGRPWADGVEQHVQAAIADVARETGVTTAVAERAVRRALRVLPGLDALVTGKRRPTDPVGRFGALVGDGDPLAMHSVVMDTTRAVLIDFTEVCRVDASPPLPIPTVAMVLEGRINKTGDRSSVLYLVPRDGAASICAELMCLAERAGDLPTFMAEIRDHATVIPHRYVSVDHDTDLQEDLDLDAPSRAPHWLTDAIHPKIPNVSPQEEPPCPT